MITSPSNGKIKYVRELFLKSKVRKKEGCFIAEGIKMFLEAPGEDICEVFISEKLHQRFRHEEELPKNYAACRAKLEGLNYEVVADELFERMTGTVTPQGILSLVRKSRYTLDELLDIENLRRENKTQKDTSALYVLLENLQDPGNLGTILRTAEAAGADGVILGENCVDIYNPKVVRSTMGALYRVPFTYVEDLRETIDEIRAAGVLVYAAALDRNAKAYDYYDYRPPCAFLIGNEGNGLMEETIGKASATIMIPMEGRGESLNASMAAGIIMYEAVRQRRQDRSAAAIEPADK